MATLDFRGFSESGAITDFVTYGLLVPVINTDARHLFIGANGTFGDNYLCLQSFGDTVQCQYAWPLPTLAPFIGQRVTLKQVSVPDGAAGAAFILTDAAGNAQITVTLNAVDGSIRVYRGRAGLGPGSNPLTPTSTQIGSASAGTFTPGTTRYLEIGAVISSVNGSVVVRVDGNVVINVTAVSTVANGTSPAISTMCFENSTAVYPSFSGSTVLAIQHCYVNDNTGVAPLNGFLGDVRVSPLAYAASSGTPAFTPAGASTNTAVCGTTPPVPATIRNISTTVGDTDTYTVLPLPPSTTTVYAVGVRTLAAKDTAGPRSLTNKLTSGASTNAGATISLGTAPVYVRDNYGTDPGAAGPWTVTSVNALKPGYTS